MKENKRFKIVLKISVAILAICTLLKIYYESKWLDLTIGIFSVEFGKDPIYRVSCKSLMYIMNVHEEEALFFNTMEEDGWILTEVYGHGHLFEKNGEEILVISKLIMNRYRVYEIQNKDYFLSIND